MRRLKNDECDGRCFFTLVELLVVISIIMLLASMLLPSLSKARDTAKKTQCMGNLKQLGSANLSYHDDYQRLVPINNYVGSTSLTMTNTSTVRWYGAQNSDGSFDRSQGQLYTYLNNIKIMDCPGFKPAHETWGDRDCGGYGYNACIGNNAGLAGNPTTDSMSCGMGLQVLRKPASVVLQFGDAASPMTGASSIATANASLEQQHFLWRSHNNTTAATIGSAHFRHPGKTCNLVWLDGHVEPQKLRSSPAADYAQYRIGRLCPLDNVGTDTTSANYWFLPTYR